MQKPIYTDHDHRYNITLFWRQFYPEYSIPEGYHVHHIYPKCLCIQDGWTDAQINHPRNLLVVHPVEHLAIHYARGDKHVGSRFILEIAGRRRGKQSQETIEKRVAKLKGKKRSKEQCERMSNAQLNRKEKTLAEKKTYSENMSRAKKGVKLGPKSEEHKEKLSASLKGRSTGPKSGETKSKMRKPKSSNHNNAISAGRLGKKMYNNGIDSCLCLPGTEPIGYKLGRLSK
jgi:hypothetical protein